MAPECGKCSNKPIETKIEGLTVLDPFGTLGIPVHIARTPHLLSGGAFPALVVVGIDPDTDELTELYRLRSLDLTPFPPDPGA